MHKEYRIADIGEVIGGGTPSTSNEAYWDGNIPWITPKDLADYNSVYISKGQYSITEKGLRSGTKLLPKNTVLFTSRAPIGYIAIAQNEIATNQGFKSIVCDEKKCHYLYLYYFLKSNLSYIKLFGSGATFPEISGSVMKKIKVNIIADISIQKKIAVILSTYDDLIEKNNRKIAILQEIAEELYKEWFVRFRFPGYKTAKFKDGIPEGWEVDKIKNRVKRLPFNRLYKEADVLEDGNIIVIDQSEKEFLGFHNNEPSHIASYEDPICLFGDHSCKFRLMTDPFSLGENVVPFKGNNINSYYLFYSTHKIIETEEYKRHWGLFVSKKILIPPMALQRNFEKHLVTIHKQIDTIRKGQRLLIKQRDLLLPRLMSGKLEVKA